MLDETQPITINYEAKVILDQDYSISFYDPSKVLFIFDCIAQTIKYV